MRENIYVIYDTKAGIAIKPPMVERNDVAPVRMLTEVARRPEGVISQNPAEFQLIHVGEMDLETLEIFPLPEPRLVAIAAQLIAE